VCEWCVWVLVCGKRMVVVDVIHSVGEDISIKAE